MTDNARGKAILVVEFKTTCERTSIDRDVFVDDERTRAMARRLTAVASHNEKLHVFVFAPPHAFERLHARPL